MAKGYPSCKDMTGQKIGRLTVIHMAGTSKAGNAPWLTQKAGPALWLTRCECGRQKVFSRVQLRGNPPRCECQRIEAREAYMERHRLRCIEYRKRKSAKEGRVYRPRDPVVLPLGHKRCTCCKSVKPMEEFHKNGNRRFKDGHGNQCKECKRIKRRERYLRTYIPRPRKPRNFRKPRVLSAEELEDRRNRQRDDARMWYAANRERLLLRLKERDRKISESLSDSYIKKMITKGTNLKYKDVPKELIETWRLKISLQRELKNLRRLQNA